MYSDSPKSLVCNNLMCVLVKPFRTVALVCPILEILASQTYTLSVHNVVILSKSSWQWDIEQHNKYITLISFLTSINYKPYS